MYCRKCDRAGPGIPSTCKRLLCPFKPPMRERVRIAAIDLVTAVAERLGESHALITADMDQPSKES